MEYYDAILIPGGGITPEFQPTPWTVSRLDYAFSVSRRKYIITLSAGTTHHPPFIDPGGFPAFESIISANYLIQKGTPPYDIMTENCSYDTIGNAFFARFLFTEILSLENLLIITSEFHMPRTRAIFEWIFNLPPQKVNYSLSFVATPNTGLNNIDLEARMLGEKNRLNSFWELPKRIGNVTELHRWLYTEHAAYAIHLKPQPTKGVELNTY